MTKIFDFKDKINEEELKEASFVIKENGLVIFPTETVYGLGANALNEEAVSKIFIAKGRPNDNPLIVHISNFDMLNELTKNITDIENVNARKVNGKYVMEGESVVIDGEANVEYVPLCGKCYMEKVMGYNIEKLKKKFLHKKPNVFL